MFTTRRSGTSIMLAVRWLCASQSPPAQTFTTLVNFKRTSDANPGAIGIDDERKLGKRGAMAHSRLALGILAIVVWLGPNRLYAQPQVIDVNQSSLKIRVFKSGAFSAFAHDHEIQAPIEEGKIDASASPSVQLRVDSRKMRVLDPEISVDKRTEIQHTMEGNAVLDVEHFPEITYRSTAITKTADAHWEVRGNLSLHGKNQPVVVVVSLEAGHYRGSASFKQSNFGITPISIAGGTVKVKDEVKIEFDIVPVP
jgi:polyisoprenoid-binding protein YceI